MADPQRGSWLGDLFRNCFPSRQRTNSDPPSALSPTRANDAVPMNVVATSTASASGTLGNATPINNPPVPVNDNAALGAVKIALRGLEDGLDMFPPLKAVVGGLLECLIHVEIAGRNRQEYENLMLDLARLASVIRRQIGESKSTRMPFSVTNATREIEEELNHIKQRLSRSETRQTVAAMNDQDDLLSRYKRLGSLFQQLQMEISLSMWNAILEQQTETWMKDLAPVHSATYDAGLPVGVVKRTGCTPKTRVEVLAQTRNWYQDETEPQIYWMSGMAGTGKTTIAYSLCEELERVKRLGASFFCSRSSPGCRDVSRIIPTIAYQLGIYSSNYRAALVEVLNKNPNLATKAVSVQFEKLVVQPLRDVKEAISNSLIVVIDALDECSDVHGTKTILEMLLQSTSNIPIKFFITSRPEPSISNKMASPNGANRSILRLHDIEQSIVQADIKTYLSEALASIEPSPDALERLVERSGRLFIFAATAVRYIIPEEDGVDSQERLQTVLDSRHTEGGTQFQELDGLYMTILSKALGGRNLDIKEINRRRCALWTVVCAKEPLTPATLSGLLDVGTEQQMRSAIQPLQSVLHISTITGVVSTLHASFPEFLLTRERSGEFYCEPKGHNSYLATRCFHLMDLSLKFNICKLETSYRLDREVAELESRVDEAISPPLFYACRYWSDHLSSATLPADLSPLLDGFLKHRLLFWMEVLSLKKWSSYAEAILGKSVDQLSNDNDLIELRDLAHDARNFATTFAVHPCSLSTPHIYISVIPFTSRESRVWKTYGPRMRGLIQLEGATIDGREKSTLATWTAEDYVRSISLSNDGRRVVSGLGWEYGAGSVYVWDTSSGIRTLELSNVHPRGVTSVALSPDNARIASGSYDRTICIWDAIKGERIAGPLQGHTAKVTSVAFSIDGARLASGSYDSMLRMWDAYSGTPLGEALEGHRGAVYSVVFSPNGRDLASSSHDCTIRVWDVQAGTVTYRTIEGHTDAIYSIAYSRDGLRLASGSADHTIRVWNVSDGTLLTSAFEGHDYAVTSIAFSPDGTRVVSGSPDHTIRVWETVSGALLVGPLEGHGGGITSVLFTADGTRIISGSADRTIRVWDARQGSTGATKSSGHTSGIYSIALSPDGARVASGSNDETIRVWDTHSGALVAGPFTGHTDWINSVAFSPDGARIVSGSSDRTLRTWDAFTGALLVGPIKGRSADVRSVAFSPDGSQIASGSWDRTIRLWDSHTGASVAEPLAGHTNTVTSIAFSSNGARIVSGSSDDTVRMWDATNGTPLWTSEAHNGDVLCVAFSPDGTRVVSGSYDFTILVLDAGDGAGLHGPFTGHTNAVLSVAFSPDGTRVVSGSDDKTVRVWDVESGMMVTGPLKGHTNAVTSVALSPDGARIISGSADHTIRIWDVAAIAQASTTLRDDWSIDDDGWLTDSSSQRLFWVPSDLRRGFGLLTPSNPIVINADCTTRIDNTTLIGDRWHECYDASSVSASD